MLEKISKIKNSKFYIDYQNYHRNNVFGITKISRREEVHSNFIAWIMNYEENGTFGVFPVLNFIKMLYIKSNTILNSKARIDSNLKYNLFTQEYIEKIKVFTEYAIISNKHRRFDILLHVYLTDGLILPIIIENKVNSKENDEQTVDYFIWGEKNYSDQTKFHKPIYVFLTPEYNNHPAKQQEFLHIKYQDMVDYVFEPTMWWTTDDSKKNLIRMYLQSLSFQNDNEKGAEIMAISKEEKNIIENFINENQEFIIAVLNGLKDNGTGEGVDPEVVDKMIKGVRENDTSKYDFNGKQSLGKSKLVLEVVKKYVEEHPGIDYPSLLAAFPDKIQGSKGVVRLFSKVSDEDKGLKPTKGGTIQARYFVDDPIKDNLAPGTESILVCNQWGAGKNGKELSFDRFLKHATEVLGYSILKR